MFWLRWDLAAATFVLVPLFWLAARRFSGSIKDVSREGRVADGAITLACGRPGASEQAIEEAAKAADAHDFIVRLPDGYDTRVDPNSARLSGGQLQRLAIARAILRDAPVPVLDEPTTGLDAMAARRVVNPLRRLMTGRTTIVITHDLNLAPDADRILVVDRGRIVETGRHEELLVRGGAYARLHRSQNNAVMDTGELRMPLWEPQSPAPVYEDAPVYQQQYGYAPYAFRDEEAWPGI